MAGRIKTDDIALVKERSSIEDVVREHVTLRPAGPGSMKGLCPFHDEKTPSFTIRPAVGAWHCFGCGEGGDVISFVQKVEHLTFTESVERLAGKLGLELHYEEGGRPRDGESLGRRSRLVEAHRAAQEFYLERLLESQEARIGRDFLRERGFGGDAARRFGVGFAPRGGEELSRHLRAKGFSDEELVLGGLSGRGSRGTYDRFRGRLVWPIRDITGDTVGFGARRLYDDDRIAAKYLNTSETPIYKKSTVLYGLDLAKKAIAAERKAVVVEGYTDVMACHLAGVEGAVASCGTAFGVDHIKVLRRIMRDEADLAPARVVFTFDGDAAGQKAAMKAFAEDQRWASQSFVAVAEGGMDPCELRIAQGDDAVRHLVDDAVPMFEFAVRTTIARFDMSTAEGRVQAMRAAAPIVNSIRDSSMRPEYVRTVAGWIGVEVEQVQAEVARAGRIAARDAQKDSGPSASLPDADAVPEPSEQEARAALPPPDLRDPVVFAERQLLQTVLQYPSSFSAADLDAIEPTAFTAPAHRAVFDGIRGAGGPQPGLSAKAWADRVTEAAPLSVRGLVAELAVAALPTRMDKATGLPERRYVDALLVRVQEVTLTRKIADAMSAMRRMAADPHSDPARARALSAELQDLQRELAQLRERAS
ncbi:DNA primase [Phycicoccus sp. M110.8]|uniref:DNA primase n=1 Tax=Phycicoccus sp. M110.8 TaxID=3075433 RepID=UPI0028FD1E7B|nr:DNA primase [Phycicoccus sp. M110.8]MDU0312148.1 DNA primase [Phycicoccus sp. M110.8]